LLVAKRTYYGSKSSAFTKWRNMNKAMDFSGVSNLSIIERKLLQITHRRLRDVWNTLAD
jgi:hypothetical protein